MQSSSQNVDIIAAETPKITKRILDKYNINTKLIINNKKNERNKKIFFINKLQQGLNVALVSDAGTPCINDPGSELVTLAQKRNTYISSPWSKCSNSSIKSYWII